MNPTKKDYKKITVRIFAMVLTALGLSGLSLAAIAAPAEEMKALLEQGRSQEAYELGRRHADQLGNAGFDLYFGVAAINGGRAAEGVLALERYLLSNGDNPQARLELARGYFLLGEDTRAKEEFQSLLSAGQPAQVRRAIEEYLDAIAAREARYQTKVSWHVEIGGGHDNNVPYGVNDPNITLPIFGDITLADTAVKRSDRYATAAAGLRVSTPLRPDLQLFSTLNAEQQGNREVDIYDQEYFAGGAGLVWRFSDRVLARASWGLATQTIDHKKYRDSASLSAEAGLQIEKSTYALVGIQAAQFRYGGFNVVRDADYQSLTLGIKQRLPGAWRTDIDVSFSGAREETLLSDRQDLSRDLIGMRLGVSLAPLPAWTISAGYTYLNSDYKVADPLLQVIREDLFTSYDFGIVWQPAWAGNWSLQGEVTQAKNRSNLPLYEYSRRAGSLKLRYEFK